MKYRYKTNCTVARGQDIQEMVDSSESISRHYFVSKVNKDDLAQLERDMGYASHYTRGLTMAGDWHVSYHRGKFRGRQCYYFNHSSIEYIFLAA